MHTFAIHPRYTTRLLTALLIIFGFSHQAHAQAGTIIFSFGNEQITGGGTTYEFDVLVAVDAATASAGTYIGDTQTYINYNTAGFGSSIAGSATVTEGVLLQDVGGLDGHEIVNVSNNTAGRLAITTDYTFDGVNNFSTALTETPQQLLHIALPIVDPNQAADLAFESSLMEGQQYPADFSDSADAFDTVTASDTDDTVLPVELVAFEGQVDGSAVVLSWQTASETNNAGFEIQRSSRNEVLPSSARWEKLGFVEGQGTTIEPQAYRFVVSELEPGAHLFRLKQVDFDGAFEYSPEVEVVVEVVGTHALSAAYPNPFNPQTSFSLAVPVAQEVAIEVYDVLGRRVDVLHQGEMGANANRVFRWEAGDHPSGLYFIRVVGERFVETQQVTLLK